MTKRNKKLVLLGLLCLVLIVLAVYFAFFFRTNRLLPLPGIKRKPTYLNSVYEPIVSPNGVAVNDNEGLVYVTDPGKKLVHIFDRQGNSIGSFNKLGGKLKKLSVPNFVTLDKKGNVYVSDRGLAGIFVFDKEGRFIKEYLPNNNNKFNWAPLGMAFDSKGNFYVTDVDKHRVLIMSPKGKVIKTFGGMGYAPYAQQKKGKLYFPNEIAITANGDIYIADGNNNRMQVFDKNGQFKKILFSFGALKGFSLDEQSGRVYVADVFGGNITVFNLEGDELNKFGSRGKAISQLMFPTDVAIAKDGTMYITDTGNNRFLIWKKPVETPEIIKTVWPYLAMTIAIIIALIVSFLAWNRLAKAKKE